MSYRSLMEMKRILPLKNLINDLKHDLPDLEQYSHFVAYISEFGKTRIGILVINDEFATYIDTPKEWELVDEYIEKIAQISDAIPKTVNISVAGSQFLVLDDNEMPRCYPIVDALSAEEKKPFIEKYDCNGDCDHCTTHNREKLLGDNRLFDFISSRGRL